jgi:hypothetical protein
VPALGTTVAEETRCRFCNNKYPDWKQTLTAPAVRGVPQPAPVLSIFYANQYARIKVKAVTFLLDKYPRPLGLGRHTQLAAGLFLSQLKTSQPVWHGSHGHA